MNKFLRYSFVAVLAVMGFGNAMAEDVVFDFNAMDLATSHGANADQGIEASDAGDITETWTNTIGEVTLLISPKEESNKNPNRFWQTDNGPQLRCYSGTITIQSTTAMKSIVFDATSKFSLTTTTGSINSKTWTGEATEVVFTVGANTQINKITISFDGSSDPVNPDPDPVQTQGDGSLSNPYTAADAIAVASALENKATTPNDVYVKGKISTITYQFDAEHGTATFNISDNGQAANEFTCYGVYYLENKSWVEGNSQIAVGDDVIIYGKLTNYNGTPETSSKKAYIYSLNGKTTNEVTPDPIQLTGDGSQSNPYLVSDLRQMTSDMYPSDNVWIKGVIIGSASSKSALHAGTEEDADVASNIAIAVSASDTEFSPVQLQAESTFRAKLNVLDNPGNKGKEVLLQGKIESYFSTTGVKNLVQAIFEGETISGISNITADQLKNAPAYNVAGQRVNEGYKGLIIKGGKKVVVK